MPRQIREKSNNKIYHTVVTGINGNPIFLDNADRIKYVEILKHKGFIKKFSIYAYCLMPNHVHILINEGLLCISSIMKSINTAYAYYFNEKYKRKGNLFHDRYKSQPIDDIDLPKVIAFIHSNPVKEELVGEDTEYSWSSIDSYIKWSKGYEADINIEELYEILRVSEIDFKYDFYSNLYESQLNFIECYGYENRNKTILSETDAEEYITQFLNCQGTSLDGIKDNKKTRDVLIYELKSKSNLSVRDIARILNINRGVVQRIKGDDINLLGVKYENKI